MAKVLVVDDEESIRTLLGRVLTGAGYSVLSAANGREAMDKVAEQGIDVVLLDMKMPGPSGMEVLQQLAARWPDICVIMVTAIVDLEIAVGAMKQGAYDYITKPFNQDDLVFKIQRALEKRNLRLENDQRQSELQERISKQTAQLQETFAELVETLAREHKLIYTLASANRSGKEALSKLPKELQQPMNSVEEFREALIKVLRKGSDKPQQ